MIATLKDCIFKLTTVSDKTISELQTVFFEEKFTAKSSLVTPGELSTKLHFISQGCLSANYRHKSIDVTLWYACEGDAIWYFKSLITGKQGKENLVFQEDSTVFSCEYATLLKLGESNHEIQLVIQKILESGYLFWENRVIELQFNDAKERYDLFVSRAPQILQRFPLSSLASYLGITQETLSRIRSKR